MISEVEFEDILDRWGLEFCGRTYSDWRKVIRTNSAKPDMFQEVGGFTTGLLLRAEERDGRIDCVLTIDQNGDSDNNTSLICIYNPATRKEFWDKWSGRRLVAYSETHSTDVTTSVDQIDGFIREFVTARKGCTT